MFYGCARRLKKRPHKEHMSDIRLSIAIGDYDHARDLTSGRVKVEGVDLVVLNLQPEEIFYRFIVHREFDISEMSMGKYISLRSQGDRSISAIPVFVSRVFRHSMIYVRDDGKITRPEQLKGKRIGIPEWAQTATIYSRGMLTHEAKVPLASVEWVQAGVNEAGRTEKVKLKLPRGVKYRSVPDSSLTELLLSGKIDAILSARPPKALGRGIRRLFGSIEQVEKVEEAYFRKTGIFPIMHVVAVRTEVLDRHPWVAMNLMKAFEESKRRSLERMTDITASHAPFAWVPGHAARMQSLFGADFWPYGLEKNRVTLEAFLKFGFEQGVCHRKLSPEELFPKQILSTFKV